MMLGNDTEIRLSRIEGKGVFALRDYAQAEVVFKWDTSNTISDEAYERLTDDQKRYIARYKGEWLFMQAPECYVNHSCDANTKPMNGYDVAVRVIAAGEEITSDYRSLMKAGERMKCRCKAENCEGFIVGTAE